MTNSTYQQYATVRANSASLFDEKLNETIYQLRESDPVVTFSASDPLCAYITYTKREKRPESVSEEYELEGVSFVCAQCPCFGATLRLDGEVDKRARAGDCAFLGNELGRTFKDSPACDHLYELIKEGSVKLCFNE